VFGRGNRQSPQLGKEDKGNSDNISGDEDGSQNDLITFSLTKFGYCLSSTKSYIALINKRFLTCSKTLFTGDSILGHNNIVNYTYEG